MYCSRCKSRWEVGASQASPCLPERRSPSRQATTPQAAPANQFNARAVVLQYRGWVTSPAVLDRMEVIAREAYALGKKAGATGSNC